MKIFLNTDTNINKHRIFLIPIFMFSILNLTGCWQVNVIKPGMETKDISEQAEYETNSNNLGQKSNTSSDNNTIFTNKFIKKNDGENLATSTNMHSIVYPTTEWSEEVSSLNIQTVAESPDVLSKVISIDENSLDFTSKPAVKYRFMQDNAPYLDLVNSKDYLEIGWHFANDNDQENVKQTSIDHAKKAHGFARQLMGDQGGQVVEDILHGQTIKDKQVGNIEISLAKCEFYSCMIVMKKTTEEMSIIENQDNDQDITDSQNTNDSVLNDSKAD